MNGAKTIASAFVEARKNGGCIESYPGERPTTLSAAYEIQDCALDLWEKEVGGWKVGKINPPQSESLGADRLVGPIFSDSIRYETDEQIDFQIFESGFAAIEAEFMLRLKVLDEPLPTSPLEAMAWVDEIRIGVEIASSPYAKINSDGPCVTVSDHGNNAGILLGQCVPAEKWDGLDDIDVSLDIDGRTIGEATTATMLDGPFGAVCFLLRNLVGRGIELQSGWWVSSGAITGVHEISPKQRAVARFADTGSITTEVSAINAAKQTVG